MLTKLTRALLLILLFVLPFQTRFVYAPAYSGGVFWEYASLSVYATELLAGLILFWFIIERLRDGVWRKQIFSRSYLSSNWWRILTIGLLLIVLAFFIIHSVNSAVSYQYISRVLLALGVAVVLWFYGREKNNQKFFFWAFWSGGVLQGIFATYQFFLQRVPHWHGLGLAPHSGAVGDAVIEIASGRWLRAYGNFGSPNSLGVYLALVFLIGLLIYLGDKNRQHRLVLSLGQIIIIAGLLFSFSRGAWVSLFVGGLVLVIMTYRLSRQSFKELFWPLFYCFIFSVIVLVLFSGLFRGRVDIKNRLEVRSLSERASQLATSRVFLEKNFWWGVGPGAYSIALHDTKPGLAAWDYPPVHNILIMFLVEWGVVMALATVSFLGWCFWQLRRHYWLGVILSTIIVAGLFDHWLISMWSGLLVLALTPVLSVSMDKKINL